MLCLSHYNGITASDSCPVTLERVLIIVKLLLGHQTSTYFYISSSLNPVTGGGLRGHDWPGWNIGEPVRTPVRQGHCERRYRRGVPGAEGRPGEAGTGWGPVGSRRVGLLVANKSPEKLRSPVRLDLNLAFFCPVLLIFPFLTKSCDWNSSVPYGVNRNTLSLSLCLHLSRSQFLCWHLAEITSARRTEREEQGTSPELVAECNPSLPSCKHQHVIILTAATLQLTVMYTRETLLVEVSETFCQQRAAQNRHKQENTPLDYITHGLSAARSWNQTVDRRDRAPDVLK